MISVEKAEEELKEAQQKLDETQRRVRQIKETGLLESLSAALEDLKAVVARQESQEITLTGLVQTINDLSALVTAEIQERKSQRARENETLDFINKYLKNWM